MDTNSGISIGKRPASFWQRHPFLKDVLGLIVFVVGIFLATFALWTFVFRTYNVVGSSMKTTLMPDDRVIVNRLPVSWAHLRRQEYVPERGQIVVFSNPSYRPGDKEQFIIKRVIAFPGERVQVKDGVMKVFNDDFPNGFYPDDDFGGLPTLYTTGDLDEKIPEGALFVAGDNREGNQSFDSRNGLGLVPFYDVIGPVTMRVFPIGEARFF